jgi:putative isomerase
MSDCSRLSSQASEIAAQIQKQCWEPRDSFYYTVDTQCIDQRAALIPNVPRGMDMAWQSLRLRVQTFTGFLPLWRGVATAEQAKNLIQANYLNDERFRSNWGGRSLSSQEPMYSLTFSSNLSNWLGPVWIIVNYFVWRALTNYGFQNIASELADKTIRLLDSDLASHGSLNEYYHPDTGLSLSHSGFIDWNLLILEMVQPKQMSPSGHLVWMKHVAINSYFSQVSL